MYISIKNHIILLLIFFTLMPILLLKIVAYPRIHSDLEDVIMDNLEVIGHKQAELVSTWMRERMKDVIVTAANPFMSKSASITKGDEDYNDTVRYLERIVLEYGYKGAFVSNDKGQVTVATSEEAVGRDISKTDFFRNAIQGKTFATSVVPSKVPLINEFEEKEVGLPTMFISTPLKDKDDEIVGVVTLRVHVGFLSNLMQSYKFGDTGETYLVNKEGYMLTESRFTKHLKKIGRVKKRSALEMKLLDPETGKLTAGVRQCVAGEDGSDAKGYNDYGGVSVLGVWQWLPEYNWGVITEIDKTEAYGAAYNLKNIVIALLLAIAFPILLIAYLVGGRFSRPILELTEITEKMAAGDLAQRVDVKRLNKPLIKDEIGVLASSFNTMAETLDKKMKDTAESERKYRELFDSLRAGIYQCEPGVEGKFTWVNHAAAEMFGHESPEEMIGTKVKDIYVDQGDRKRLVERLEKDGVWKDFVSFCKKKSGEKFYTERTSNLVRDKAGKPTLIQGVIRDITERKKLEDEQKKSAKKRQG
ncbi:MAG: cache domain-containing protein [Candidatus Scalindua sp.]